MRAWAVIGLFVHFAYLSVFLSYDFFMLLRVTTTGFTNNLSLVFIAFLRPRFGCVQQQRAPRN
jgi:hypothetical protein